jgi:putative transposase
MIARKPYPSDLTDAQWMRVAFLIPPAQPGGRPRTVDVREVLNAILYITRGGNDWRMLPHDFPPWQTAYYYFRRWQRDGTWERIHDTLREQVRTAAGRNAQPSAAVIDSQSVKTTEKGGSVAMTGARKSTDVSATSWLIRSA